MSRTDQQRIDDLEHHLMVAESVARELESTNAALAAQVESLKHGINELECAVWTTEDLATHDAEVLAKAWGRMENTFLPVAISLNEPVIKTIKAAILGKEDV